MRNSILRILILCWVSLGCQEPIEEVVAQPPKQSKLKMLPAFTHKMLVFGRSEIYLAPLPVEGRSRRHQMILKVSLHKQHIDMLQFYNHDRRRSLSASYSLLSEPFSLSQILGNGASTPQRRSFRATLYRGTKQAPETAILRDVTVQIEQVLLARSLSDQPNDEPLSYFVFGNAHELFAAHWLQDIFDFDHVAEIRFVEGLLSKEQAAQARNGVLINLISKNEPTNALENRQSIPGLISLRTLTKPITLEKIETLYPMSRFFVHGNEPANHQKP